MEEEFCKVTQDLLLHPQVQSMEQWLHHGQVSCLEHSLFVAMVSFKIGKKLHLDSCAMARAGLLHDFYLYHKRDKSAHSGFQCFDHPVIAVANAKKITSLSAKEENIILSHMFPFGKYPPHSPEALLVNMVDSYAAILEFCGVHSAKKLAHRIFRHSSYFVYKKERFCFKKI